jgi:hypothetical protein
LVKKVHRKGSYGRLGVWEDGIEMDLKEIRFEGMG